MNSKNNDDLYDFISARYTDTSNLVSLAESLLRSLKANELETAHQCPDRALIQLLVERIGNLNELIGDRL